MDNYAIHKRVEVRDCLANLRTHVHFTPTSGSLLNLDEVWFGIVDKLSIHRGVFGLVKDLNARICAFVWAKAADNIFTRAVRTCPTYSAESTPAMRH